MIFSDLYKSPRSSLSKRRHHHNQGSPCLPTAAPDWDAAEYADLLHKDKAKQKEAVKRYLLDKVRGDWEFQWPQQPHEVLPRRAKAGQTVEGPRDEAQSAIQQGQDETRDDAGYHVDEGSESERQSSQENEVDDQEDDAKSVYSLVTEDDLHYRPRIESTSDLSDDDASPSAPPNGAEATRSANQKHTLDRRARHRRALRDEMAWNDGLACFEARRNAWTGAKTVRVRSKHAPPALASPRSPRRFFFRHSVSVSPPASIPSTMAPAANAAGAASDASSLAKDNDRELKMQKTQNSAISDPPLPESCPVETLLPVGQPLLPPNNSLRASIIPAVYVSLYDKVVINNLQPACPVNLSDMLRSCVAGWKRDGEWPPRGAVPESTLAIRRYKKGAAVGSEHGGSVARRMSLGLLGGREKDDEFRTGKGIRRSLQRALGIGLAPGGPNSGRGGKVREA